MGEDQLGGVDNLATEVNEVDVDRSWAVPDRSDPSKGILNGMHPPGKVERIEFCLENRHLIEELECGEFRWHADRLRLDDGTRPHKSRFRQDRQGGDRPFQVVCPRLDVGSEGDDGARTWPWGGRL